MTICELPSSEKAWESKAALREPGLRRCGTRSSDALALGRPEARKVPTLMLPTLKSSCWPSCRANAKVEHCL